MRLDLVFIIDLSKFKIAWFGSNAQENTASCHMKYLWMNRLVQGKSMTGKTFIETIAILELARATFGYTSIKSEKIYGDSSVDEVVRGRIYSLVRALRDKHKYLQYLNCLGRIDQFPYVLECLYELKQSEFDIRNFELPTNQVNVHFIDYEKLVSDPNAQWNFLKKRDVSLEPEDLEDFRKKVLNSDGFKLNKFQKEDCLRALIKASSTFRKRGKALKAKRQFPLQETAKDELKWFVGRDKILQRVESFVEGHGNGLILITGSPGMGKTAIMEYLSASQDSVSYFFRNLQPADRAYSDLLQQLKSRDGVEVRKSGKPDENFPVALLSSKRKKPLLVCLDAINESASSEEIMRNLPKALGQNVFLVLSSRDMTETALINSPYLQYKTLTQSLDSEHEDNLLSLSSFFIKENPGWSRESCYELARLLEGNFQFAKTLLDLGHSDDVEVLLNTAQNILSGIGGNSLGKLYGYYWSDLQLRLRSKHELWDIVTIILGMLAFAYEDLSRSDLLRYGQIGYGYFDSGYEAVREFLTERVVDGELVLGIYHSTFKEFVAKNLAASERRVHTLFIRPHIKSEQLSLRISDRYVYRHFFAHISQSEYIHLIPELLTPEVLSSRYFEMQDKRQVLMDMRDACSGLLENDELIESYKYLNIYNILKGRDNLFDVAMLAFYDALSGQIERAQRLLPDVSSKDDAAAILAMILRHKYDRNEDYSDIYESIEELVTSLEDNTIIDLIVGMAQISVELSMRLLFQVNLRDGSAYDMPSDARYDFSAFDRALAKVVRVAVETDKAEDCINYPYLNEGQRVQTRVSAACYALDIRDYQGAIKWLIEILEFPHARFLIVSEVLKTHLDGLDVTAQIELLSIMPDQLVSSLDEPELFNLLNRLPLEELSYVNTEKIVSGRIRAYTRYLLCPSEDTIIGDSFLRKQHLLDLVLAKYENPEVILSFVTKLSYHALIARLFLKGLNSNGICSIETFLEILDKTEDIKMKYYLLYEGCSNYLPEKRIVSAIQNYLSGVSQNQPSLHREFWRKYADAIASFEKQHKAICFSIAISYEDQELAEYFILNTLMFCPESEIVDLWGGFWVDIDEYFKEEKYIKYYPPKLAIKAITIGATRLHWFRSHSIENYNSSVLLEWALEMIKRASMNSGDADESLSWVLLMDPQNLKRVSSYVAENKIDCGRFSSMAYFTYVSAQDVDALSMRKRVEVILIGNESEKYKGKDISEDEHKEIVDLAMKKIDINFYFGKNHHWLELLKVLKGNQRWWSRYVEGVVDLLDSAPNDLCRNYDGRDTMIQLYKEYNSFLSHKIKSCDRPEFYEPRKVLTDLGFSLSYIFSINGDYKKSAEFLKFNFITRKYHCGTNDFISMDRYVFEKFKEEVVNNPSGFVNCVVSCWDQLYNYTADQRVPGRGFSELRTRFGSEKPTINREGAMTLLSSAQRHLCEKHIRRFFFSLLNLVNVEELTAEDLVVLSNVFDGEDNPDTLWECLQFFKEYDYSIFEVILKKAKVKVEKCPRALASICIMSNFLEASCVEEILKETDDDLAAAKLFMHLDVSGLKLKVLPHLRKLDDIGSWAFQDSLLRALTSLSSSDVVQIHVKIEQCVTKCSTPGLNLAHDVVTNYLLHNCSNDCVDYLSKSSSRALAIAVKKTDRSLFRYQKFKEALLGKVQRPKDVEECFYLLPLCGTSKCREELKSEIFYFILEERSFFMKVLHLHQLFVCIYENRKYIDVFWIECAEEFITKVSELEDLDDRKDLVFHETAIRESLVLLKVLCGDNVEALSKVDDEIFGLQSLVDFCMASMDLKEELVTFLHSIRTVVPEEKLIWIYDSVVNRIISKYKGNECPFKSRGKDENPLGFSGVDCWVLPDCAVDALLSMKESCSRSCREKILFHAVVSLWDKNRSKVASILEELRGLVVSSTAESANDLQADFWVLYVELKGRAAVKELIHFYVNLPRLSYSGGKHVDIFRFADLVFINGMNPGQKRLEIISSMPVVFKEFMDLELADYSRLPNFRL